MSAAAMVCRLARFILTTGNVQRLAAFYEAAFDCRRLASHRLSGAVFEDLMDVKGGAESIMLSLGGQRIDLLQFDRPGRTYPAGTLSSDLIFQHLGIVVSDIRQAYQRLLMLEGWSPISNDGPQRLPASSGGVTAFKFRDPDGHPLELLAFPSGGSPPDWRAERGLFSGIDHSAIVVSDSARSRAFYETLGFSVASHSLNTGIEQEKLDGILQPRVEVTALTPYHSTPHIESLCYRSDVCRPHGVLHSNDVAATHIVMETDRTVARGMTCQRFYDPDGHLLLLVPPS